MALEVAPGTSAPAAPDLALPAGLMALARILNMGIGLVMIPVLLHALGSDGFGAWAVLLAASVAFSTLEIGLSATLIKFAAPLVHDSPHEATRIWWHVAASLILIYAGLAPVVVATASFAAVALGLPDGSLLGAGALIVFTFGVATARAVLQTGVMGFYAARNFRVVACTYFLQTFLSHAAGIAVALSTARLDLTLISFWVAQLAVLLATFGLAAARLARRPRAWSLDPALLRAMWGHGVRIQMSGWSELANFQLDKFVIAIVAGLAWVAPYEIANRSVIALRSIPTTGMDTFLPAASLSLESASWQRYGEMNRLAAYSVVAFMVAPLAVSPIFLFAWTGQFGYGARWMFVALMLGAVATLLAYPAATLAQASGRTHIQARAAIVALAVNVPTSIAFVLAWGPVGGAIASAIAMGAAAATLLRGIHRFRGWHLAETLRAYAAFWPALLVCTALGIAANLLFISWLESLDTAARFGRDARLYAALMAAAEYAVCVALALNAQLRWTGITEGELRVVTRLVASDRFARWCGRFRRA